ncbi:hypothetical protein [Leptospira sp. GIMC2001]|uniref:hypothetical protein n=1 Tax=Leptospira sp. GIMC2001 TaxID=1513297 RepID=UPI00234B6D59|nr:hypothetical protein [Leptospira sp. GIMC2001]WCL48444.1 hypothetical protein O4O04_14180 [Leptospira sp. GIMC2001]
MKKRQPEILSPNRIRNHLMGKISSRSILSIEGNGSPSTQTTSQSSASQGKSKPDSELTQSQATYPEPSLISNKPAHQEHSANEAKDSATSTSTLPIELEKKRSAIFNTELKDLVDRVKSPGNATTLPVSKDSILHIFKNLVAPEKKEEFKWLSKVHIPERRIQDSGILDYTAFLLDRVGIEFFSWHFLSYDTGAYFCEMSHGLDSITRKNFIFLKNDPFIKPNEFGLFELEFTPELLSDPFFSKKFSVESLSYWSKVYFFFITENGVDACLVAFQQKVHKNDVDSKNQVNDLVITDRWLEMLRNKIVLIAPALARYRSEKLGAMISIDDMLTRTIHLFRSAIGEGLDQAYVTKLKILKYKETPNIYYLKRQLISNLLHELGASDKLLELSLDSILLLSGKNMEPKIRELLEEDPIGFSISTKLYPANGENILLYI